jgi:methyl-accepting chemotaxis protein
MAIRLGRQEILLGVVLLVSAAASFTVGKGFGKEGASVAYPVAAGVLQGLLVPAAFLLGRRSAASGVAAQTERLKEEAAAREGRAREEAFRREERETEERDGRQGAESMRALAASFDGNVRGFLRQFDAAVSEIGNAAGSLSALSEQGGTRVLSLSDASGAVARDVQGIASSVEELSSSVKEISGQVHKSARLVNDAAAKSQEADRLADALTQASEKVGRVMNLISDISGQINLLALNATIESARAGEAGRGFAVVAGEVKNLAGQTDKSIQEIESVIKEMQGISKNIVEALSGIRCAIGNINEASGSIASAVEEQSATANEIARNMQAAAVGTSELSDAVSEVADGTQRSGSASSAMKGLSERLAEQARGLKEEVERFLRGARAA